MRAALEVEPAAGEHDDFRREIEHVLPGDAIGRPVAHRQRVVAAGDLDQLLHPMPAAIGRVDPFHAEDPRAMRHVCRPPRNRLDPRLQRSDQALAAIGPAQRHGHGAYVVENARQ